MSLGMPLPPQIIKALQSGPPFTQTEVLFILIPIFALWGFFFHLGS